ncbi:MAG TPA: YfhO family protein [Acidimicrobiales bacterium]|nr:YfhO family protein [Acidimicrobiales bacterium]
MLDGQGQSLWVKLALDHWWGNAAIPYWIGEMWSGTPAWGLAPTFPVLNILPLAALIGPEEAVRVAGIAAQIAGAWGAFALAQSLWKNRPAALVAGVVYGLHPIVVSHLALFGHQPSMAVIAATPWFVLTLREALRGRGRRWIAMSGLLAGFCVLEQAEHTYGLLLLAGCLVIMELARAGHEGGRRAVRALAGRAMAIGALALGMVAYWLLPLLRLKDSFILTPPRLARYTLMSDIGGRLGKQPELFLRRNSGLDKVVTFNSIDVFPAGAFYIGWVCLALTVLTVVLLARRRDNGTLSAILLASVIALWTSSGGIALAANSLADGSPIPFLALGALCGLLVGGFIRNLGVGRMGIAAGAAAAMVMFGAPFVAPFLGLQQYVPLLSNARFPRFYPIAILGLALGAAYPVTLAAAWLKEHRPVRSDVLLPALTIAIVLAFVVDVAPYRSFYDVRPPDPTAGYERATTALAAAGDTYRVAGTFDPRITEALLSTGRDQSTGWPHPLASPEMWHLSFEALAASPHGFRDSAFGLSSTGYYVVDPAADPIRGAGPNAPTEVESVTLERNPRVLPIVRAYDGAVLVRDAALAPDLAVALSQRGIGVVTGGDKEGALLGDVTRARVRSPNACVAARAEHPKQPIPNEIMSGEVAAACALHKWVGGIINLGTVGLASGTGGTFTEARGDLKAITVWLDRPAASTELILRELGADGRTLGPIVTRSRSAILDENEMAVFPVEPDATSPGKRYMFLLSCIECTAGAEPRLGASTATRGRGDLIVNGELQEDRVASFGRLYDRVERIDGASTTVEARRTAPGHWSVNSDGTRPSLVVVGEAWFPGWEAHVDGKPVPALKADGAFVGIPVAAGTHHITLSYEAPGLAVVGKIVSAVALLVAAAMLLPAQWRRSRRHRRSRAAHGRAE